MGPATTPSTPTLCLVIAEKWRTIGAEDPKFKFLSVDGRVVEIGDEKAFDSFIVGDEYCSDGWR